MGQMRAGHRRVTGLYALCAVGWLAGIASPLVAEETPSLGCLDGTVTGSSGVRVLARSVVAREAASGVVHEAPTDPSGHFAFRDLPPGAYEVVLDAPGFSRTRLESFVAAGGTTTVEATLAASTPRPGPWRFPEPQAEWPSRHPASDEPTAPVEPVELVVEPGRRLQVRLADTIKLGRVGQSVTGTLMEPVYAYDRVVLPAGTKVLGHVQKFEGVPTWTRVRAILHGDFTPLHRAVLQFDALLPGDCRVIPISTRVNQGTENAARLVAGAAEKKGMAARAKEELARRLAQAEAPLKEPGKMQRVEQELVSRLPYHPQYLRRGTVYAAELLVPLDFGTVWPTQRSSPGEQAPADAVLNARLVTPLDSKTTPREAPVRAVLTQPLFSSDHRLMLPAGTELDGAVTFARPAARLHHNGQLRFLFDTVQPPQEKPSALLASLYSAQLSRDDDLAIDEEGGARVESSKTRFIAPALALLAVRAQTDFDGEHGRGGIPGGRLTPQRKQKRGSALGGFFGMNLLGVAMSQVSAPVSLALGVVGAARSLYTNVLGPGREVVMPADTSVQLQLAPDARPR